MVNSFMSKLFGKSKKNREVNSSVIDIPLDLLPKHVGIIMDGNGRWAKMRGIPRQAGHSYGAKTFRTIIKYCEKVGVSFVTVYAFSTENWKRSKQEINGIMKLLEDYLNESLLDFKDENILTRFIGDISGLSPKIQNLIDKVEQSTGGRDGMVLNIALNYGGREEITQCVKSISKKVAKGEIEVDSITEQLISDHMYTAGQPDPDMILRPSGERRTSNFLIWQSAYSELVFMDVLWPDFTETDMHEAFVEYARRNRRFGKA